MKATDLKFIFMICLSFAVFSCSTTDNNENRQNVTLPTLIRQNIPSIFWGVWSGSSGKTMSDNIILNNEIILPSGEIHNLSPEESAIMNRYAIVDMNLHISKNQITEFIMNSDELISDFYIMVSPEKEYFLFCDNNLVYIWLNKTGYFSETQVFNIHVKDENTLYLISTQQCNYYNENLDNNIFNTTIHPQIFRVSKNLNNQRNLTNSQINNMKNKILHGQFENRNKIVDSQFQGTWVGNVNINSNTYNGIMNLKFEILNDNIVLYTKSENNTYQKNDYVMDYYDYCGKNIVYVAVHKNKTNTYIDTYSLALINDKEINIIYSQNANGLEYLLGEGKLNKE
jgi:hypothetical protein